MPLTGETTMETRDLLKAFKAVLPFFEPEMSRGPAIDNWNAACRHLEKIATYDQEEGAWELNEMAYTGKTYTPEDVLGMMAEATEPKNFRIGQLEGAIKGALLHLESWEVSNISAWEERNVKVIANLKQLIGNK